MFSGGSGQGAQRISAHARATGDGGAADQRAAAAAHGSPSRAVTADAPGRAAAELCARAAHVLGSELLPVALPRGTLADGKQTWLLREREGAVRAVAQLSSACAPDMVARGVARANEIRRALDRDASAPILEPLATGAFEGASFAVWPFCLHVPNRATDVIARRIVERPVLRWLRELVRQTARPVPGRLVAGHLDRALCAMAAHRALSSRARLAARAALRRLDGGQWRPMHVAMHGDLHAGNLLLDHQDAAGRGALPLGRRFVVIDWCGATLSGQPLFDLIRIADALRTPRAAFAREIQAHCALLGGTPADAVAHAAAALADLGTHLECFPVDAYAALADRVLGRLDFALHYLGEPA